MNKTEASRYLEEVRGHIIGGDHSTGEIFYEGRSQSHQFYGSEAEIREQAKTHVEHMKERLGAEYKRLYPKGLELRIWD